MSSELRIANINNNDITMSNSSILDEIDISSNDPNECTNDSENFDNNAITFLNITMLAIFCMMMIFYAFLLVIIYYS